MPVCREVCISGSKRLAYLLSNFLNRSGGHMHFPGAAGIENGVTIDLGLLKEINYFQSNSSVSVGPGAVWGDVYSALDKLGVMVVGGRSTTIGVIRAKVNLLV